MALPRGLPLALSPPAMSHATRSPIRRRRLGGALPRWMAGALLAAACAAPVLPTPAGAQRGPERKRDELESLEITNLRLRGVKAVDEDELRKSIATDESGCKSLIYQPICLFSKSPAIYRHVFLDREEMARDILRIKVFYFKRGYRETQVDTAVARAGRQRVEVTFRITEGPPTVVDSIAVVQDSAVLDDKQLRRDVRLGRGDALDLLRLDSSVVRLHQALWERGFADAVIDTAVRVDAEARRASITITIDPKWLTRVGSIVVRRETGDNEVSDRTILNSLSVRPGDIYVRSEVLRSQRSLYESNLFTRASIVVPPQGDSLKEIEVSVREAPLREVRTSLGFSTADFGVATARFTNYNFFGGARRLTVSGGVGNLLARQFIRSGLGYDYQEHVGDDPASSFAGNFDPFYEPTWQGSVDLTQPWFLSPRNTIGASAFAHRRAAFGVFIDRGFGAQTSFTRELMARTPASATYRYELSRVEAGDVYFCVNFGVCDVANISALRGRQSLSPFTLSGQTDRTDDPFSPASGMRADLIVEHASAFTASDYRYNRAFANASVYRRVRTRGVIALRVQAGWARALSSTERALGVSPTGADEAIQASILHPRKRFYAGGAQSVRGFGENQLGPRVLTIPAARLVEALGCDLSTAAGRAACDVNKRGTDPETGETEPLLSDREFTPRPLGGNVLLGANAEFRFPIWKQLGGAAFVDAAIVSQGSLRDATKGTGAITPGIGARYYSPVGPIRVDLGFNPVLSQDLIVVTEQVVNGTRQIVQLPGNQRRTYAPARTGRTALSRALNRVTLHLSIGQAF